MKTKKLLIVALIGLSVIYSCKKEKVKGCIDVDATNYKSDAEEDDGSCTYKGTAVIYWGKRFSDSATFYGTTALKVYVDGTFIDSKAASTYWTTIPSYGVGISASKDLGSSKTAIGSAELKDQSGNLLGTIPFTWDKATTTEIEYRW